MSNNMLLMLLVSNYCLLEIKIILPYYNNNLNFRFDNTSNFVLCI